MNWYVKGVYSSFESIKDAVNEGAECCEHCYIDGDSMNDLDEEFITASLKEGVFTKRGEMDSFGPVCIFISCHVCEEANQEAEDNETVHCDDCKQARARKDTIEWRWYDFYAPQGDEPLVICTECQSKPKHVKRVAKDEADYRYEMGE